MLMDMG